MRKTDRFGNVTKMGKTPGGRDYRVTKSKSGDKYTTVSEKNKTYSKDSLGKMDSRKGAVKKGPTKKAK